MLTKAPYTLSSLLSRFHSEYFHDEDLGSFGDLAAFRPPEPAGADRDDWWVVL